MLLWRKETCQTSCVMSTTMSQHVFCDLFESICVPSTHVDASDQQNFAELSFALIDFLPLSNSPMIKLFANCFVSWRSRNFLNYQKVVWHLVIAGNWQIKFLPDCFLSLLRLTRSICLATSFCWGWSTGWVVASGVVVNIVVLSPFVISFVAVVSNYCCCFN